MSYRERRTRKDRQAKPGRLDRTSGWSLHAFGACQTGCLYCYTERAIREGTVRTITNFNPIR